MIIGPWERNGERFLVNIYVRMCGECMCTYAQIHLCVCIIKANAIHNKSRRYLGLPCVCISILQQIQGYILRESMYNIPGHRTQRTKKTFGPRFFCIYNKQRTFCCSNFSATCTHNK